jgi:hypothetical protein
VNQGSKTRLGRRAKTLVAVLALVVAALGAAQPSGASPPQTASGSGVTGPPIVTDVRLDGGNVFLQQFVSNTITGTFNGTVGGEVTAVLHPNTNAGFHGFMTFTGTTPCGFGTVLFAVEGKGTVAPPIFAFDTHFTSVESVGTLQNVHAVLDAAFVGFDFTYTGKVHCGP